MSAPLNSPAPIESAMLKVHSGAALVGILGLGYVGLPLACAAADAGYNVVGFDIDDSCVRIINQGRSHLEHMDDTALGLHVGTGRLSATSDFAKLSEMDIVILCVPTPITAQREPDLSFVVASAEAVARTLKPGQLIVLESTTWPGTTVEILRPILERNGLRSGVDFFLAFSPEREDPGNANFTTARTPKVVGGDGAAALELATAFYGRFISEIVQVSSSQTAEAVKLTENIFRAVNIALVNELKVVFDAMGVDVWEVIEAAKTKPFGYMPFYPGPGLGGHCIPIDPFYLTWKAREFGLTTQFIELAGQINTAMPVYVVQRTAETIDRLFGIGFRNARILLLGLAYKKNIPDVREAPALKLIKLLEQRGAQVDYSDPHVPTIPRTHEFPELEGRCSIELSAGAVASYDAVLIVTDHDRFDYADIAAHAKVVVDTRNACGSRGLAGDHIVKA